MTLARARLPRVAPALRLGMLALAALAAGCAAGPDYRPPAPPAPATLTASPMPVELPPDDGQAAAQRVVDVAAPPSAWWRVFGSPSLDALVERALQHSPTLAEAQAALRQADELLAAGRAAFWPTVQAELQPTRGRSAAGISSPLASGASMYTLQTAQLAVGYPVDVFGGTRRDVESLVAQRDAQAWQLQAARQTLAAQVASAVVQSAALDAQLQAAERASALAQRQRQILQSQQRLGDQPVAAVVAQDLAWHQAEAAAAGLRKQLAQQHDLVALLVGALPGDPLPALPTLDALRLPDLPTALPAVLVAHRPDVRAAEAQLHAANAQVGAAAAALLPQLSLSANYGASAEAFAQLWRADALLWSVGAQLTQTLFDGGALRHRRRAAEAGVEQALAQYRATVLTAFQNVADGLEAARHDAQLQQATAQQEEAATHALHIAQRQLQLGDIAGAALLQAESSWQQARMAQAQARGARLADVIAMYQAVGGDWAPAAQAGPDAVRAPLAPGHAAH